jgi:predicted ATPase
VATLIGLPEGKDRDRRELLLQINLGTALGNSKGYTPPEVGQAFSRARELCEQVGDMPQMFSILVGLWVHYVMRAEYDFSGEMDEQILALARQSQDTGALVAGHHTSSATQLFKGDFHRAIEHADFGCEAYDYEEHRDLALTYGFNPGPLCHDFAAWALLIMGYPEQAIRRHELAVDLATKLLHPLTVATVVVHASIVACLRDDIQAALSHARDAIAISKESGILIRQTEGEMLEGWALAELGDTEHGIPQLETGLQVWHQLGAQIANPLWYSCLARAYIKADRIADARETLKLALDATNKNGERLMEAELYRIEEIFGLPRTAPKQALKQATERPSRLPRNSRRNFGNCAPRRRWLGYGGARVKSTKPEHCCDRCTTGSPRASIPKTSRKPRRCSISFPENR